MEAARTEVPDGGRHSYFVRQTALAYGTVGAECMYAVPMQRVVKQCRKSCVDTNKISFGLVLTLTAPTWRGRSPNHAL